MSGKEEMSRSLKVVTSDKTHEVDGYTMKVSSDGVEITLDECKDEGPIRMDGAFIILASNSSGKIFRSIFCTEGHEPKLNARRADRLQGMYMVAANIRQQEGQSPENIKTAGEVMDRIKDIGYMPSPRDLIIESQQGLGIIELLLRAMGQGNYLDAFIDVLPPSEQDKIQKEIDEYEDIKSNPGIPESGQLYGESGAIGVEVGNLSGFLQEMQKQADGSSSKEFKDNLKKNINRLKELKIKENQHSLLFQAALTACAAFRAGLDHGITVLQTPMSKKSSKSYLQAVDFYLSMLD